jgi:sulfoquinovosyltransferase
MELKFFHKSLGLKQSGSDDSIPSLSTEPPLKILLLVEPTPFNYVSGYANRFKEMLKFLHAAGDEVRVLTADKDPNPPLDFMGYPITTNRGFEFILYNQVTLTFDLKRETQRLIKEFKPDLIHVSSPSSIIWPAIIWSKVYNIPLVMSYHTNFVEYSKTYGGFPGAAFLAYKVLRFFHDQADLTLCTSPQLAADLEGCGVRRVDVWQKGINAEVLINPNLKSNPNSNCTCKIHSSIALPL